MNNDPTMPPDNGREDSWARLAWWMEMLGCLLVVGGSLTVCAGMLWLVGSIMLGVGSWPPAFVLLGCAAIMISAGLLVCQASARAAQHARGSGSLFVVAAVAVFLGLASVAVVAGTLLGLS
ncbi:MAG: hypothetical protein L0Z62_09585 [Gemmataceae bacterium]|nr:hypothetical protein [Gemmataceae bacterium]